MKTSRYTEPQILSILLQAEGGVPVAELCREHGMMPPPGSGLIANHERECVILQVAVEVWWHALSGFCSAKPCRVTDASIASQMKAIDRAIGAPLVQAQWRGRTGG
jgi:hypothetical protein